MLLLTKISSCNHDFHSARWSRTCGTGGLLFPPKRKCLVAIHPNQGKILCLEGAVGSVITEGHQELTINHIRGTALSQVGGKVSVQK